MAKAGSGISSVPMKRVDDLVQRIAVIKADADARGFGSLAYFLDMALIEANSLAV